MTIINRDTFQPADVQKENAYFVDGTVECTFAGRTERVSAFRDNDGMITIRRGSFVGSYQSSSKPWPATITTRRDMRDKNHIYETVEFGRDDRSSRFNKANAIRWAI